MSTEAKPSPYSCPPSHRAAFDPAQTEELIMNVSPAKDYPGSVLPLDLDFSERFHIVQINTKSSE